MAERHQQERKRKVARAKAGHAWLVAKQDTLQFRFQRAATRTCMPWVKRKVREELQVWCLFGESEHEQWQGVISRKNI